MTPRAYTWGWLWLLAVPAFAWYLSTLGPLREIAFNAFVPQSVYLANLRESELACRTLALRRAQVVVLGDSHSYAAWDFARLESRLQRRVGACALGGLYAESVAGLVKFAAQASPGAGLVVLGLSPRMFWESPTRREQIEVHRILFKTMSPDMTPFLRRILFSEPLPYDGEAESLRRHASRIEALNEDWIVNRLDRSQTSIRTLRDWNARLRDVRYATADEGAATEACRAVRAARVRLWVLHMPESPYLETRYPKEVWARYLEAVNALRPCAERIVLDQAVSYGLGNRHYVNRQLKDGHDYAGWKLSSAITDDLAFDADHLNPVGAALFTSKALDRLGAGNP